MRLYGANQLQKACFEADVLLFGCLWVACASERVVCGNRVRMHTWDACLSGCCGLLLVCFSVAVGCCRLAVLLLWAVSGLLSFSAVGCFWLAFLLLWAASGLAFLLLRDVCGVGAWLRSYGGTELEEVVGEDLFA